MTHPAESEEHDLILTIKCASLPAAYDIGMQLAGRLKLTLDGHQNEDPNHMFAPEGTVVNLVTQDPANRQIVGTLVVSNPQTPNATTPSIDPVTGNLG